jgi:hypothetical protein
MLDGAVYAPHGLGPCINEKGYSLLPTPAASDTRGQNDFTKTMQRIQDGQRGFMGQLPNFLMVLIGRKGRLNPGFVEKVMMFPTGWTELNPLGTA